MFVHSIDNLKCTSSDRQMYPKGYKYYRSGTPDLEGEGPEAYATRHVQRDTCGESEPVVRRLRSRHFSKNLPRSSSKLADRATSFCDDFFQGLRGCRWPL